MISAFCPTKIEVTGRNRGKNRRSAADCWVIKPLRNNTKNYKGFRTSTAVPLKSTFVWDIPHCRSYADGRIILRWIFRKWEVGVWTGSIWLMIGTGGGHL